MANALANVAKPMPREVELETIENELAATQYAQRIAAEQEEELAAHKNERVATSVLQGVTSMVGGALSTLMIGKIPIGGILNTILGVAGVGLTVRGSERAGVRVAGHTLQTHLHNQIAIVTRDTIRGVP
ncbi:hypothetical protein ACNOYE_07365 [Nannocystaceae bacterium ST9]